MACFQVIFLVALLSAKDFGHRIKQRSTLLNSKFLNSKLSDQNYLTRNTNKRRKFCVWQNIGHPSPSFRVLSQCRYRVIINKRTGSNFGHFSHRPFRFMFLSCNRHVRSLSSLSTVNKGIIKRTSSACHTQVYGPGGARGAAAPPNFRQLRFFGQQEKIWAKPVFKDVSMFFYQSKETNIFYFNLKKS